MANNLLSRPIHTPSRFEDLTRHPALINETQFRNMMGELRYPRARPLTQEERNDLASAFEHMREAIIDLVAQKEVEK